MNGAHRKERTPIYGRERFWKEKGAPTRQREPLGGKGAP